MNDDRTDLEVFQQCRDLVFGDWTSAAIFVPMRVWIGEKLLHHLLRCYLRAVLGKHRPQCREVMASEAASTDFWNVEPWPEPVETRLLLQEIITKVCRYIVLRPEAMTATALWTMTAWAHEGAMHSPILAAISVEPDSGKSTLLGVLRFLVPKPFVSVEPTGPSVRTAARSSSSRRASSASSGLVLRNDFSAFVGRRDRGHDHARLAYALPADRGLDGLWLLPISLHYLWPTEADLALLSNRQYSFAFLVDKLAKYEMPAEMEIRASP